jgi:hypothetical protein
MNLTFESRLRKLIVHQDLCSVRVRFAHVSERNFAGHQYPQQHP